MAQIFRIAKIVKLRDFTAVDIKEKVSKNVFWELLSKKVFELTKDESDKYDEIMKLVTDHLLKGKSKSDKNSIQINDICFEVKGIED